MGETWEGHTPSLTYADWHAAECAPRAQGHRMQCYVDLARSLQTLKPTFQASKQPFKASSNLQTLQTNFPTFKPTFQSSNQPSTLQTNLPTFKPTCKPANHPPNLQSSLLNSKPSVLPSSESLAEVTWHSARMKWERNNVVCGVPWTN